MNVNSLLAIWTPRPYPPRPWMVGRDEISKMQTRLAHLQKLVSAIAHYELQCSLKQREAIGMVGDELFDCMHEVDIYKRAAKRLRQTFNNEAMEIQL